MNWEVSTMLSKRSYFNAVLYRKNLARFWPIWAIYGAMWLLILPLRFLTAFGRHAHPEEGMIPCLCSVIKNALIDTVTGQHNLFKRHGFKGCAFDCHVQISEIGLVMLTIVVLHRFFRHGRSQRI